MQTYKLTKTSGQTELIQAKNLGCAERVAYGRRNALKDQVVGIILQETETEKAKARELCLNLY